MRYIFDDSEGKRGVGEEDLRIDDDQKNEERG